MGFDWMQDIIPDDDPGVVLLRQVMADRAAGGDIFLSLALSAAEYPSYIQQKMEAKERRRQLYAWHFQFPDDAVGFNLR